MIEAFNKVLKHQFLYPRKISNRTTLEKIMTEVIPIYNNERPQLSLGGNTPNEIFNNSLFILKHLPMNSKHKKHSEFLKTNKIHVRYVYKTPLMT